MFVEANSIIMGLKKGKIIHPVDEYIFTENLNDKYDYCESFKIIDKYFETYNAQGSNLENVIVYVDELIPALLELVSDCYCKGWNLYLNYYDSTNNDYRMHAVLSKNMYEMYSEE